MVESPSRHPTWHGDCVESPSVPSRLLASSGRDPRSNEVTSKSQSGAQPIAIASCVLIDVTGDRPPQAAALPKGSAQGSTTEGCKAMEELDPFEEMCEDHPVETQLWSNDSWRG